MADDSGRKPGTEQASQPHWIRQYPPLLSLVISLLIAFLVLPSSLNLPQSNPSTVLEFAPVPPEDDDPPPPQDGSLSSLGLGSSSSLSTDSAEDITTDINDPSQGARKGADTRSRSDKRCVGSPPRQTEDPNSPPCVAFFDGDNFGSTWQGVTKDEITVLVYSTGGYQTTGGDEGGAQAPSAGLYCDVDKPAATEAACLESLRKADDHQTVRVTRALSKFFNDRFQTYRRHVHFYIYWSSGTATTATRRADAQANWDRLKPFAALDAIVFGGFNSTYAESMARRRSQVYGNFSGLANEFYRRNAPFIWTFWPDVEHQVALYHTYICTKVAPFPAAHAGGGLQGRPRKFAFLSTTDAEYPGLQFFAKAAKDKFAQGCPNGARVDVPQNLHFTFPNNQYSIDSDANAAKKATENIAVMEQNDVTTILWLAGFEVQHSKAAATATYFPEWVLAGDLQNDQIEENRFQDQEVWKRSWVMSNYLRDEREEDVPCRQAFQEADPSGRAGDMGEACERYRDFFVLFRGIQAAGPRLTPQTIDQGNHAIPRTSSTSPFIAASFYDPGDYSSVKDAQESWWDPDAADPDGDTDERGCHRMVRGGRRFLTGEWPAGDDVFRNRADPCNNPTDNTIEFQ